MKRRTDRRVVRTRKLLQDALLALMARKPFRQIHVSEIAEQAGLARPTFYLHFRSKEDLLLSHLDRLFEQYTKEIEPYLQLDDRARMATRLFEQLQSNSELIRLMVQTEDEITHLVLERLLQYIRAVFRMLRPEGATGRVPPHLATFALASLTGATYGVVLQWVKADMPYSPEVMGQVLMSLVRPGLENVLLGNELGGLLDEPV